MRRTPILIAWIISVALIVIGGVLVALFPQPYVTYYCSATVCSSQASGGFSIWWVLIALGLITAVVVAIVGVAKARGRTQHS